MLGLRCIKFSVCNCARAQILLCRVVRGIVTRTRKTGVEHSFFCTIRHLISLLYTGVFLLSQLTAMIHGCTLHLGYYSYALVQVVLRFLCKVDANRCTTKSY